MVVFKQPFAVVGHKLDDRTAFLRSVVIEDSCIRSQFALRELGTPHLSFAVCLNGKETGQRIHSFGTDTVQTHGFLESLAVILASGVQHTDYFHQLAQRNSAPVVPYAHPTIRYIHFDDLSFAHSELINRVVNTLFDKHVDSVIGVTTVA